MTTIYRLCTVIVIWPILLVIDAFRAWSGIWTWEDARQESLDALRHFWENRHD